MVKLRLTRMGRHKRAYYRLVATDSRNKVNGGYIELLGNYDPISGDVKLQKDVIMKWLNNGAQPSETVKNLLQEQGIWKEFKNAKPSHKPKSAGKNKIKKETKTKKTKK